MRFIDLARQMEAFFLQKRFLLSALKPEMVVKEDISELKIELARKEELLKKHHDKINVWQSLLTDLQGYAKSPAAQQSATTPGMLSNGSTVAASPIGGSIPGNQTPSGLVSGMTPAMQQQLQQQQLQHQQQLQQMQQQQQLQQMQQQMQVDRR